MLRDKGHQPVGATGRRPYGDIVNYKLSPKSALNFATSLLCQSDTGSSFPKKKRFPNHELNELRPLIDHVLIHGFFQPDSQCLDLPYPHPPRRSEILYRG